MFRNRSALRDPRILRSLQYFEAVARHGSVKLAAEEVGISASAISHQLRELTQFLGEELVKRHGRGIALTPSGRLLHGELSAIFASIDTLIEGVIGPKRRHLRLAVCSSFGPFWLARRLPSFHGRNPGIDLEFRMYGRDPEQTEAVADAIVSAEPVGAGFDSVVLFEEMLIAVCAPPQANGVATARSHRMITTDPESGNFAQDWRDFLSLQGHSQDEVGPDDLIKCTHYLMALGLAKAGLGVALVPDFLAEDDLASGALQLANPAMISSGRTYRICYKMSRSTDPDLRSLVNWMREQTSGTVVPFQKRSRA